MLAFSILTVFRSKMVRLAKWDDLDLRNKVLRIHEESIKTKERGDHYVYLSATVIKLLRKVEDSEYIFSVKDE